MFDLNIPMAQQTFQCLVISGQGIPGVCVGTGLNGALNPGIYILTGKNLLRAHLRRTGSDRLTRLGVVVGYKAGFIIAQGQCPSSKCPVGWCGTPKFDY